MNPRSRRLAGWVPSLDALEDRALLSPLTGPMPMAPTFTRDVTIETSSWQSHDAGPGDRGGYEMAPSAPHGGSIGFDGFGGGRMHGEGFGNGHLPQVVIIPRNDPRPDANSSGAPQAALANLAASGGAASAATSNGVASPAAANDPGGDRGAPVTFALFRFAPPAFASHASPPGTAASAPTPDASLQTQAAPVATVSAILAPASNADGAAVLAPTTATADLPVITQSTTGAFLAVTRPFSSFPQEPLIRPGPLTLPADPAAPAEVPAVPMSTDAGTPVETPAPVGADLIAELSPLDSSSLEAALSGLIARFDGLETPLPHTDGDGNLRLAPIALGVAAFEVARRWWNSRPDTATRRSWKTRSTLLRGFF